MVKKEENEKALGERTRFSNSRRNSGGKKEIMQRNVGHFLLRCGIGGKNRTEK